MDAVDVFALGGEVGCDLGRVDWAATPLGDPGQWPDSLTTVLRVLLTSRFSMWMAWGDDLTFFCNDAYRRDTLGAKYPWALGRAAWEVWGEIWTDIGPRIDSVLDEGTATWDESLRLMLERNGYREETYHTFSYSPLAGDDGTNVGMLCVVAEVTERVIAERRMTTLRDVAADLAAAATEADVFERLTATLASNARDMPFSLTYLFDGAGTARLAASTGAIRGGPAAPDVITIDDVTPAWPGWRVHAGEPVVEVDTIQTRFPGLGASADGESADRAVVLPLALLPGAEPFGFFVAGLNPHRPADDAMLGFVRLVSNQLAASISSTRSLEGERRRAEALAELDRVKSRFFANISHEFRTPLTLILDPIAQLRERIVADGLTDLAPEIDIMHRNALRLSRLVNSVLDFSRLQAGRMNAHFEPTDLAAVTIELASMFRSAVEKAGLEMVVQCSDLGEPAYVDVSMWDKVVLNLLSNALKFTFDGRITLTLDRDGDTAVLRVRDTGVGIPDAEVPRLFERFHRVERTRARSSEGSGIGLALVAELVALHGGEVAASSTQDIGSEFSVIIPLGTAHLASDQIAVGATNERPAGTTDPYVAEALRWTPDDAADASDREADAPEGEGEILVVDDNADMRAYLSRVLRRRFSVRTATNGAQALDEIRRQPPDLVLSDVMMPGIDGLELVRRIRAEPGLADLPFVLLTAASGSDESAAGIDIGADDYLVKPFSSEHLIGRVAARLAAGAERRQRHALGLLSVTLTTCRTAADTLRAVQPFLREWMGAAACSLTVLDPRGGRVRMWHEPAYRGGINERYRTAMLDSPAPIVEPMRTGTVVTIESLEDAQARYPLTFADIRESGVVATIVSPIKRGSGETRGTISSGWERTRRFTAGDIALHQAVAAVVGDALARIRDTELEQQLVEEFQGRLLEIDHRSLVGVVAARYRPADSDLVVGGDWYDVLALDDGSLGASVGDVVGKGLVAATVMSQLRTAVRLAATSSSDPSDVLTTVDDYTRHVAGALCATAVYVRIERSGAMAWSCAGHPPPLVRDRDGVRFLTGGRRGVLGFSRRARADDATLDLAPGSLVLLYTDGLVERRREDLDVGLARLRDVVERHDGLDVSRLCDTVLAAMEPPGGFGDDVALVAIRTVSGGGDRLVDAYPSTASSVRTSRRRFVDWLAGQNVSPGAVDDILLAFGEATANALEHGNKIDGDRTIGVEAFVADHTLSVAISDSGRWDDDSTRSQQAGRGRGFAIMNAVMDSVDVHHSRLGTTVVLTRHLA